MEKGTGQTSVNLVFFVYLTTYFTVLVPAFTMTMDPGVREVLIVALPSTVVAVPISIPP